ncbi:hypothetical protein CB0940_09035 [Cercospora beticola]|uniref:MYND-type domain-containing protein n=1 Tax=Cercospora beticola TaxID=122368 RepID=A0A2G5HHM3_CERBT|nr:hypothetical protein CB0940_09035 [Cercospora beticola]PIA92086.1 hypothetical protein CB0940_09035 [Cercospora beticola]WPB06690.1 hypothetical protein RHO25_011349 [Cercospora beticola]
MSEPAGQASNTSANNEDNAPPSDSSSSSQKTCANCNKAETSTSEDEPQILKPCTMCHSVSYCSRDCKKSHAKKHKKVCAGLAQEYAKTAPVKMASRAPPKADTFRGGLQKWQFDT